MKPTTKLTLVLYVIMIGALTAHDTRGGFLGVIVSEDGNSIVGYEPATWVAIVVIAMTLFYIYKVINHFSLKNL